MEKNYTTRSFAIWLQRCTEDGRICWYMCHEREVHRIQEFSCDSLMSTNVHSKWGEKHWSVRELSGSEEYWNCARNGTKLQDL